MQRGYGSIGGPDDGSAKQALRDSPVSELEKASDALRTAVDEIEAKLMPFMRQEDKVPTGNSTAGEAENVSPVAGSIRHTAMGLRIQRARILAICRNFDL